MQRMPSEHYFVMRKAVPPPIHARLSLSDSLVQCCNLPIAPESPIHGRTACNASMQTAAFAPMHRFSGWCLMAVPALSDITIDVIISGKSVV